MSKQIHFTVPDELFEAFHRVFPVRGQKKDFFLRIMSLAVDTFEGKHPAEEVWEKYNGGN